MEQIITSLISSLSPSALPVVVLCLGGLYLWFKFGRMEKDRQETKAARDTDSQEIHDKLLKHEFEITNIKGELGQQRNVNDDINKQIVELSKAVACFSTAVDNLVKTVDELKDEVKDMRAKK